MQGLLFQGFASLLARLDLLAQLDHRRTRRRTGKSQLYLSPALAAGTGARQESSQQASGRAGRDEFVLDSMTASEPIAIGTLNRRATLVADLYYRPASGATRALVALLSGIIVLLAGLAVAVWLAGRWMVAPLARLSAQVDKVAGGDLAIAVPRSRIGEIANIAQAVEGMTAALGETAQRRAEADEARRFLVTSIAHDLRTPLFALRGHLQAIRSRLGNPAVHLQRAEARADALERLIGNLFAYTRDDYTQPAPQLEAVPVAELAPRGHRRARARDPPPTEHVRARRRPDAHRHRRSRPPQTRTHQHPRQRTPLQPRGRPDPPQLDRPSTNQHIQITVQDHGPESTPTSSRTSSNPASAEPRQRQSSTAEPGSASRSQNASSNTSTPPSPSATMRPGALKSASLSSEHATSRGARRKFSVLR